MLMAIWLTLAGLLRSNNSHSFPHKQITHRIARTCGFFRTSNWVPGVNPALRYSGGYGRLNRAARRVLARASSSRTGSI